MGITGHIAVAFDPCHEDIAIAVVMGGGPSDVDWPRYKPDYDLIKENYMEVHYLLQHVAAADPARAPLATLVFGQREVGEGPTFPVCLYRADEVRLIAEAFDGLTNAELERAGAAGLVGLPSETSILPSELAATVRQIEAEVRFVAANGWSMIGFMV